MSNILEAICNITTHSNFDLTSTYVGRNRANSMGDALEQYMKDAFANTFDLSEVERMQIHQDVFSWLGSQNNPPDMMLKGGDAIEVKKTQSANSSLALNSSYPKAHIYSNSKMITESCRNCESWTKKDIIYCVGHTSDRQLKSIWMVYGNIYAAEETTYQRIKSTISSGIGSIEDVMFAETKELGRVNRIDPLGITNLRIRGMWQIENPRKVFSYLHEPTQSPFELIAIIPTYKYNEFPPTSRSRIERLQTAGWSLERTLVKDPNNPANLINCQLIKWCV
jgi:hypothetical protein